MPPQIQGSLRRPEEAREHHPSARGVATATADQLSDTLFLAAAFVPLTVMLTGWLGLALMLFPVLIVAACLVAAWLDRARA